MKLSILFLVVFSLMLTTSNAQNWNQKGTDIDGEAPLDFSGGSICSSAEGSTIAIGAFLNDGSGTNAGHVRVYKLLSGEWIQLGADIDGEAADDNSGWSVSLSTDGLTLAIGAPNNDGNGADAGHVRVYKLISGAWSQVGADIDGETAGDESGWHVSLSGDGLSLAIGAPYNDDNGNNSGHVRVYKLISGSWTQQGIDIDGEVAEDFLGVALSFSADGLSLAIGTPYNDQIGFNGGLVRVYKFISEEWTQQGLDIVGEAAVDLFGASVSLSADGLTVAIGAHHNDENGIDSGHVRVFKFISDEWIQQGSDINGEAADDLSGEAISLSADGLALAVGASRNDGNGSSSGHVRVYKFISGSWTQVGADIDGEGEFDSSGESVSLSADGLNVAIGARRNDGNGVDSGHVRVFALERFVGHDENMQFDDISVFPNPTTKLVSIELGKLKDVTIQIFNVTGQLVHYETDINLASYQFELNQPRGFYFIQLGYEGGSQQFKLVKE